MHELQFSQQLKFHARRMQQRNRPSPIFHPTVSATEGSCCTIARMTWVERYMGCGGSR